jgi:3-deoxy-manno-octulosonate cytidylyltransferase (CMP-KDO synthetase)
LTLRAIIVIPARLGSTRLPGKALLPIAGKPMIAHVVERALEAAVGPVVLATESREIADIAIAVGATACLTDRDHRCGTDRIGEALEKIDPSRRHDAVVNLQGDQPFLEPQAIHSALALLADDVVDIATLAVPAGEEDAGDPNAVKLVGSLCAPRRIRALYFTRAPAPFGEGPRYKHIGLYAFRRRALERFVELPPSALELRESLEQLRALEAGMRIDAALLDKAAPSVDTGRDLEDLRRSSRAETREKA